MQGDNSGFMKLIGENVRSLRKTRGMRQEDLAEKAGLKYSYVAEIERGKRNITLKTLEKLILALDVLPEEILTFNNIQIDKDDFDKKYILEVHNSFLLKASIEDIKLIHRLAKDIIETYH